MKYKPQPHRNHCIEKEKKVCDVVVSDINVQQSTQQSWQKPYISGISGVRRFWFYQWNDYKFCVKCAHMILLVVKVSYVLYVSLIPFPFPFLMKFLYIIHVSASHHIARFQTVKYWEEYAAGSKQLTTHIVSRYLLRSVWIVNSLSQDRKYFCWGANMFRWPKSSHACSSPSKYHCQLCIHKWLNLDLTLNDVSDFHKSICFSIDDDRSENER